MNIGRKVIVLIAEWFIGQGRKYSSEGNNP